MKLIITHSIRKTEVKTLGGDALLSVLKEGARKSIFGPHIDLSSVSPGLFKIAITSPHGHLRAAYFVKGSIVFFVVLRKKGEKKIGENMSKQNADFLDLIDRNFDRILEESKSGDYEEISL